jgi:hypothetical protein
MTKLYVAEYIGLAGSPLQGGMDVALVALPPAKESVIDTAATTGPINVLGAITAGTLYTNGTYTNVPLTGGTGSGATANITVSGGGVTAVTLVNRGTGYTAANSLSAAAANIGGTGSGFAVAVTSIFQMLQLQPTTAFVEVSTDGIASIVVTPAAANGLQAAGQNGTPAATTNLRLAAAERKLFRVAGNSFFSAITNT